MFISGSKSFFGVKPGLDGGAGAAHGLDTAFLTQVEAERAAYAGTDALQTDETSGAQQDRVQRQTLFDSIKQRRQTIQLAAEFLWPSTDPANAPTRREFGLPPSQPYLS